MDSYKMSRFSELRVQSRVLAGYRVVWACVLTGVVVMGGMACAVAFSVRSSYMSGEPLTDTSFLYEISGFGFSFAQIFFGLAAIVFICSEWESGFIYTTYAASQRPLRYVLTKSLPPVLGSAGVLFALLVVLVPAEALLLSGSPYTISLADPMVWRQIFVQCFTGVCSALFAAGLAFLFRRPAVALGIYVAITLIAPIVLGLIPLGVAEFLSRWLPNNVFGYLTSADAVVVNAVSYPALVTAAVGYPLLSLAGGYMLLRRSVV
ncbi:hypothetical protein [Actinomyces sp.]|uniref:hypothetical protein n=1 Tax=Actinomyces sp. TaxID=29317 RepID=UPI0026DB286F|nr:hypothetical protein [Actinomyces sp.]MDO4901519.1 hypothetical protein [Actinomyces sp.]